MFHAFCIPKSTLKCIFLSHVSFGIQPTSALSKLAPKLPTQNSPIPALKIPPQISSTQNQPQNTPPKLAPCKSNPKPQKHPPQIYPFEISSKSVSKLPPKTSSQNLPSQYNPHICHTQNQPQNYSQKTPNNAFIWSKLSEQENSN